MNVSLPDEARRKREGRGRVLPRPNNSKASLGQIDSRILYAIKLTGLLPPLMRSLPAISRPLPLLALQPFPVAQ
jgi:hypothetical protein